MRSEIWKSPLHTPQNEQKDGAERHKSLRERAFFAFFERQNAAKSCEKRIFAAVEEGQSSSAFVIVVRKILLHPHRNGSYGVPSWPVG